MSLIQPSRRGLIAGFAALIAAPAIVKAESLMRVNGDIYRVWKCSWPLFPPITDEPVVSDKYFGPNGRLYVGTWTFFGKYYNIYDDEVIAFTKRELALCRGEDIA